MAKIINAVFGGGLFATTAKVFQYDVGDKLRFLGVDLPDGYSVDFANSRTGTSTTVYGDSDGVTIPPEYFIPGTEIYAWVVISDADGHYTRYQAKIPIYERAARTSVEPTPAQADALDEAINALNNAVENVQDIADNLNDQIDTALAEAKASGEFDGEDGSSVWTVDAQYIRDFDERIQAPKSHMVGPTGAVPRVGDLVVVSNGRFGSIMFVSPVAAIVSILGDLTGPQGADGAPGQTGAQGPAGEDGYSPAVSVTEITGGHRVTITDAEGDHVFDVLDGQGGGGGVTVDDEISGSSTNPVQNKVIKAALDEKANISSVPTKTSDLQNDSGFLTQHQSLAAYRTAAAQDVIDAGKADKVTEVTVATDGAVSQALDAGKVYHFTGALTALTLTLNAAAAGQQSQYHFDFVSGSTAPTVTIPASVTMPDGFQVEADKRYEIDILDGYGVAQSWEVSA